MSKYASKVERFAADASGATALEYAAAGAFIATAALGLFGALGTTIKAESYATLVDGKMLVAASKRDMVRIAARSSSDPIQTGSTAEPYQAPAKSSPRARNSADNAAATTATALCNAGDKVRPCKLDLTKPGFQGWRGTLVEWSRDH